MRPKLTGERAELERLRLSLAAARSRCTNQKVYNFHHYGGRGIKFDPTFAGLPGARRFLAEVGERPSRRHTIDRINNDGDYAPGNVRWATREQQGANKRTARRITWRGETRCMAEWARCFGVSFDWLRTRVRRGDTMDAIGVEVAINKGRPPIEHVLRALLDPHPTADREATP